MIKAFQYKIKENFLFFQSLTWYKHLRKQRRKKFKSLFFYFFKRSAKRESYNIKKFYLQSNNLWYTWKKCNLKYSLKKKKKLLLTKINFLKFKSLLCD